jgi:transcriptional regulator with XRE-family HTH domain
MAVAPQPEKLTLEQAIGQILRNLRQDRGLKRVDVAVATNFAVTTLKNMEGGRQSMTIRSLDALSMFYQLPIEKIIIDAKKLRGESI